MFNILDLDKFYSVKDLLKQTIADEQDATRLASQSAMNVCKALISIIILDSRCASRDDLPTRKETRESVFAYLPKTDKKNQANYNKASVISYMLDAKKAAFVKLLSKTQEYTQQDIMVKVFGILASYNGVNEVLRKVKDARKPKETQDSKTTTQVSIEFHKDVTIDDRIGVLIDKACKYLETMDKRSLKARVKAICKRLEKVESKASTKKASAKKASAKKAA